MSATLPQLLDCKTLMDELGVKRATAEAIMRRLPKVQIDDHRKVFCTPRRRAAIPRRPDLRVCYKG